MPSNDAPCLHELCSEQKVTAGECSIIFSCEAYFLFGIKVLLHDLLNPDFCLSDPITFLGLIGAAMGWSLTNVLMCVSKPWHKVKLGAPHEQVPRLSGHDYAQYEDRPCSCRNNFLPIFIPAYAILFLG